MDTLSTKEQSTSSLVSWKKPDDLKKPVITSRKKILDEDTYIEEMDKIITRDFFPDLNKLRAQNEYIKALENGDMAKIQELQTLYRPKTLLGETGSSSRRQFNTPATFETPDINLNASPPQIEVLQNEASEDVEVISDVPKKLQTLDQFLAGTTSEDNASFEEIMVKDAIQHKKKHPWLYKDEEEEQKKVIDSLALPSSEKLSIEDKPKEQVSWTYRNKNALMYVPDGSELTAEERLKFESRQQIQYVNTRFAAPPFDEQANKAAIAEAASIQAKMKEGRVGIDGKELVLEDSPKVNGYGFIGSASPMPGVTDTPIMTWGEIEGTPFRLDGSDTPLPENPGGQQFKMPDIPARERIALSLADKASKKNRKKKQEALKHVTSSWLTPSPKFGSLTPASPMDRLSAMSPAAQKLVCAKLGIHRHMDKALRASYSPSPLRTPSNDRTPEIMSPSPVISTLNSSPKTVISTSSNLSSHAVKRQRAMDFF